MLKDIKRNMLFNMETQQRIKDVRRSALTLSLMSDQERNSLIDKIKDALDSNREYLIE